MLPLLQVCDVTSEVAPSSLSIEDLKTLVKSFEGNQVGVFEIDYPSPSGTIDVQFHQDEFLSQLDDVKVEDECDPKPHIKTPKRRRRRKGRVPPEERKRRPKVYVPEHLKDEKYWKRREKNNAAARRRRAELKKERQASKVVRQVHEGLNVSLKSQVELLKQDIKVLKDALIQRMSREGMSLELLTSPKTCPETNLKPDPHCTESETRVDACNGASGLKVTQMMPIYAQNMDK